MGDGRSWRKFKIAVRIGWTLTAVADLCAIGSMIAVRWLIADPTPDLERVNIACAVAAVMSTLISIGFVYLWRSIPEQFRKDHP